MRSHLLGAVAQAVAKRIKNVQQNFAVISLSNESVLESSVIWHKQNGW